MREAFEIKIRTTGHEPLPGVRAPPSTMNCCCLVVVVVVVACCALMMVAVIRGSTLICRLHCPRDAALHLRMLRCLRHRCGTEVVVVVDESGVVFLARRLELVIQRISALYIGGSPCRERRARSSAHPNRPTAPEGPLDSISSVFVVVFIIQSMANRNINGDRRHPCHPSLPHSCLYLEGPSNSACMSTLTCHPIICVAYQCYTFLWYTVVSKNLPGS